MDVKKLIKSINSKALLALCESADNKWGDYPEHRNEGEALFTYYEEICNEKTLQ